MKLLDAIELEGLDSEAESPVPLDAALVLGDGTTFTGRGAGGTGLVSGELIFSTAMTGYQEALTDPSYRGQLLMFTYPLIGNYGMDPGRAQSGEIQARGAILSTLSPSWDGQSSLRRYLDTHHVPTLYDVDTRAIARWVREHGAMPAALGVYPAGGPVPLADLHAAALACSYDRSDFLHDAGVSTIETYGTGGVHIVLLDCGNKRSVIDELVGRDARLSVVPVETSATDILALRPDGVVISNGPGNPAMAVKVIESIRALYDQVPLFGICLGHQLLALAAGGRTSKLKFGHRGANHPVQDLRSGKAFVTTQNHGYTVEASSLPDDLQVSHRNLNDGTVEGLIHRTLPIRSVQFHPEGAPGPRDAGVLLDDWLAEIA